MLSESGMHRISYDGFHASVLQVYEDPASSTSETVVSLTEIGRREYLELQTGVP